MRNELASSPAAREKSLAGFPPPEALLAGLWPLLERQALLYTGGDSSSLPLETAARLFESLLFCLEVAREAGCPGEDPATLLRAGQRALTREAEAGRALLRRVAATAPSGSASLDATLAGIGHFFRWYDIRFFAHEIPADIDYPLCLPVEEGLRGIRYIGEYLGRLGWENRLLGCFAPDERNRLLDGCRPGWRETLHNLCAPVFASVLGSALVGGALAEGDALSLTAAPGRREALEKLFAGRDPEAARELLARGAARACNGLRLWDPGLRGYFADYARTLAPLACAADGEGRANLFPAL